MVCANDLCLPGRTKEAHVYMVPGLLFHAVRILQPFYALWYCIVRAWLYK